MNSSLSMAAWAGAEYLAYPLLMCLATPALIRHLGLEAFGLWMLMATVVGSCGVASLGGEPMIIQKVAIHRDQCNRKVVGNTLRQLISIEVRNA